MTTGQSQDNLESPEFDTNSLFSATSRHPSLEQDDDFSAVFDAFINENIEPTPDTPRIERELPTYENDVEDSENDDLGLNSEVTNSYDKQDDGEFGDDEQVDIASDSYKWKIDHTEGEYRFAGTRSSSRAKVRK